MYDFTNFYFLLNLFNDLLMIFFYAFFRWMNSENLKFREISNLWAQKVQSAFHQYAKH